ncbi:MAG: PDZ domain-containing protein, partial [Phycisphaerales bacterium]|nr:PDZ domain-containing protein [Phycisphaerales bacterium]
NSGGPLVNLKGEIVGINELGGNGIGFAIPSDLAQQVVNNLIEHGEVPRSWIGISLKSIQKTGYERGAIINSVVDGGPAAEAGIQPGDLLLRLDGQAITIRFNEQIPQIMRRIADFPIGTKVNITYQRGEKTHETTITTVKLTKDRGDETSLRGWGVTAEEITDKLARDMKLSDALGAMVSGTRSGGPAELAEPSLRYGDIIRSIDGEKIESLEALVDRYREIMDQDELPEYLLIEFDRQGKSQLTLIKPKPDDPEDPPRDIRKAWIGIATQPIVEKLARFLKMDDTGFRITRVYPRTTAADTDLKVGDIVVAMNAEKFQLKGMQDGGLFQREVKKLGIGDVAKLTVIRDGKSIDIDVTTQQTPWSPAEARRTEDRDFELTVRNITFFGRDDNLWTPDVKGVIIEQAEGGGWASNGGLQPGDLIQEINGIPIKSRTSFKRAMKKIGKEQPERVVFKVLRGALTRFQYVEPEWKPELEKKADESAAETESDKE